jgi:hypothetical protein
LQFDGAGVAQNLEASVIRPLQALAQQRIGIGAVAATLLPVLGYGNRLLAQEMDRVLWHGARLADLSELPRIVFNSVDLDTAESVQFDATGVTHSLYGRHAAPDLTVSAAVAASCAFTPFTAPAILATTPDQWEGGALPGPGRLLLVDGVLQDNLGLDPIWHAPVLFISDSSLPRKLASPVRAHWHSILVHAQRVQFHFAREQRLARLREAWLNGRQCGAYWGLSEILWRGAGGRLGIRQASEVPGCDALPQLLSTPGYLLRLNDSVQQGLEQCGERLGNAALAGLV